MAAKQRSKAARGGAPARVRGVCEAGVNTAILTGRQGQAADGRLAAYEALARTLARGMDAARAELDPYAMAQLGPKFAEILDRLGLAPVATADEDGLAELLADLARPDA